MVDVQVQLSNIIVYLMEKLGANEIEIPQHILENRYASPIVATRDPINVLNQNVKLTVGETK